MNFLLDLVGTGKEPLMEVTIVDNIQNWLEENFDFFITTLLLGICIGIGISYIYYILYKWYKSRNKSTSKTEESE